MSKFVLIIFFLIAAFSTCVNAQALSDKQKDSLLNTYVTIPGTKVQFVPPAYFKPFAKDGKFGYIHEGASSTISFQIADGTPYLMTIHALTPEFFKSQNLTLVSSENVRTKEGIDAKIYVVSFKVKSKDGKQEYEFERIMFFTGDLSKTIWINANYPVVVKKMLFEVLKQSILTVKF